MKYHEVQQIAKDTMQYARQNIVPGMTLLDVRKLCEKKMLELGADSFWYWDIGAFVFSGTETTVSVSGPKYRTSEKIIESSNIITIDLSPQNQNIWGDYARTIIIENGKVVEKDEIESAEWKSGLEMEDFLHEELRGYARPDTTFEELYYYMNGVIESRGFINLDFLGNLGHSIVKQKSDRVYIEKGNKTHLGDVSHFTFEPHISRKGAEYGYKKENIYYFENGKLLEL